MAKGGGPVGAKVKRVSGSSAGTTGGFKKDGYAKGPVHKSMLGTKNGINDKAGPYGKGYTGPEVQRGEFP
jgi:hypothetical protein